MTGRRVGVKPNTSEWLAWRAQGITATDVAAILGVSTWSSPFSLWWRKTADRQSIANGETLTEMERSQRFQLGHDIEPVLHRFFVAEVLPTGWRIGSGGCWQGRGDKAWMRATPDRVIYPDDRRTRTPIAVAEFKTDGGEGFGDDTGDGVPEIPVVYRAQLLWQMHVVGVHRGWLSVLTSRMQVKHYLVIPQDGEIEEVASAAYRFEVSLQDGDQPDIDGHEATTATLKRLNPDLDDEEAEISADLAIEYAMAVDFEKDAKRAKAEATNRLLAAAGNARWLICNEHKIATRSVTRPRRFSETAFKADHPDLYEQYRFAKDTPEVKIIPAKTKTDPQPIKEKTE